MKRTTTVGLLLVAFAGVTWFAVAGDMEPPGPPAPTMVTLQQIYDKLGDCCTAGGSCGVPKTGQTWCTNHNGEPVDCAGTGQDGEYQAGFAVDPRFTDNADGTITDNLTGLIWLRLADCWGWQDWYGALSVSGNLASGSCGLTDGSVAGDWRLPNLRELDTLVDYGQFQPPLPPGHPFDQVRSHYYWTSTTHATFQNLAWTVDFSNGFHGDTNKSAVQNPVWPVRGGL